jgi:putative ABC transport system ATP-binding protein
MVFFAGALCIITYCDICHEILNRPGAVNLHAVFGSPSLRSFYMQVLEANNVTKQYQMGEVSVRALDEVSFAVQKGSFVAVMGPSGSGKSTLLHLLGGLDEPTGGEITLAGQPISHLSDDEVTLVRRRKVGFIFQFYNLVPTLTAKENVALPLMIDGRNVKQHQEKIEELLTLVGLDERMDHKPDQMSGGQQQRVAIARAFVNDPQIVLADEPTGNLDSKSGTVVLQLLRQFCDERQQTIVMVTHDPRAASYADRVAFLKDGRTVQDLAVQGSGGDEEDIRAIMRVMRELEL